MNVSANAIAKRARLLQKGYKFGVCVESTTIQTSYGND